jgi:hypothetical protein
VRQPIPAEPGQLERYDCEYRCNGTVNLFVCIDVHAAGPRSAPVPDWPMSWNGLSSKQTTGRVGRLLVIALVLLFVVASFQAFDDVSTKLANEKDKSKVIDILRDRISALEKQQRDKFR